MKKSKLILIVLCLMLAGCHHGRKSIQLRTGDLLFVGGKSAMDQAIVDATGIFTHVGIVVQDSDALYVYDATPRYGVRRWTYDEFMHQLAPYDTVVPMRLKVEFEEISLRVILAKAEGTPYDSAFAPYNGVCYYCSELVQNAFLDEYGSNCLFQCKPMNWRDSNGDIPPFWIEWFERVGVPIPEGEWGTNPDDMYHAEILEPLK